MAKYRFTLSHIKSGQAWASAPVERNEEEVEAIKSYLKMAVKGQATYIEFEQLSGGTVIVPDEVLQGCVVSFFEHTDPAPPTGAQTEVQ